MKILATVLSIMLGVTGNVAIVRTATDKPAEDTAYIENQVSEIKQITKRKARAALASEDAVYTVTFDCNGGIYNGTDIFYQTVEAGALVDEPDNSKLYRNYSNFIEWRTLSGKKWKFAEDAVNENMVLQAEWEWDNSYNISYVTPWGNIDDYLVKKYYKSTNWNLMEAGHSTEK